MKTLVKCDDPLPNGPEAIRRAVKPAIHENYQGNANTTKDNHVFQHDRASGFNNSALDVFHYAKHIAKTVPRPFLPDFPVMLYTLCMIRGHTCPRTGHRQSFPPSLFPHPSYLHYSTISTQRFLTSGLPGIPLARTSFLIARRFSGSLSSSYFSSRTAISCSRSLNVASNARRSA